MGIVVIGAVFVDIKGFPSGQYIPQGRNVGWIEQVHGGVSRNVAEDIANVELRPTYVSLVDNNSAGEDVIRKLRSHKVNTDYVLPVRNGMGTWLAVFDHTGDVVGSISQRPDMTPLLDLLEEKGDEIFSQADSIVVEICLDKEIVKKVFRLANQYGKPVYAVVANMSIAVQRRDFLQDCACFICNRQEAGILFSDDYSQMTIPEMETILVIMPPAPTVSAPETEETVPGMVSKLPSSMTEAGWPAYIKAASPLAKGTLRVRLAVSLTTPICWPMTI